VSKLITKNGKQLTIIIIIININFTGKDTISFMQGIYTYIPEKSNVPKEHNVVTILSLLFMVPISLAPALALMYYYISTFRSMCAVPNILLLLLLLLLCQVIPLLSSIKQTKSLGREIFIKKQR
jgi:small-conductance mechanosensitive channel